MTLVAEGPPKLCPECGFMRPRSDFYGIRCKKNGVVYAQSLCKEHTKARVIAYAQKHLDKVNERRARYRDSRRRDPERLAFHQDYQREWARRTRGIPPERYRFKGLPVRNQRRDLDPEPFATWLQALGTTTRQISLATGLEDGQVRKYLGGRQRPSEGLVDRVLCHVDNGTRLEDLYPHLYEQES